MALTAAGTQTARADDVTWFDVNHVVEDSDHDYDEVSGMEFGGAGPDDSNVNAVAASIGAGFNAEDSEQSDSGKQYYVKNPRLEFEHVTGPSEVSIDDVTVYQQGEEGDYEEEVEYVLETMWNMSPIPAPSPTDYIKDDEGVTKEWKDGQSHVIVDYWGTEAGGDTMCGFHFNIHFGADGACEPGKYGFRAKADADVYRIDCLTCPESDHEWVGYHSATQDVFIDLTSC
jgi:hypothetical protein